MICGTSITFLGIITERLRDDGYFEPLNQLYTLNQSVLKFMEASDLMGLLASASDL